MAKAKHNTNSSQKAVVLKDIITPKIQNYKSLFENLDLKSFSYDITLQDYQIAALKSAITTLKLYASDSETLYQGYLDAQKKIPRETINTASFWMATGSGKSIVMIKLLALLQELFSFNELPAKPIMLLVPNDKILEQFKNHIREYNALQSKNIVIKDLKDYESITYTSLFGENIVFIGRSDLLDTPENVGKDPKAKRLNYKNFFNEQGWYILLDEAHKGDSKDSVRKSYIRAIAKGVASLEEPKGFIFNFSATFSDNFDLLTCAFNYNLEKFNREGYGKNIAVLDSHLRSFKDSQNQEEQITRILEHFILLCAIKQHKQKVLSYFEYFAESKSYKLQYHNPLIIAVADKVNTTDAGIKLYFEAILSILKWDRDIAEITSKLYEKLQNQMLFFESISLDGAFLECIRTIDSKTLRKEIFYANETSAIEACKIKGNDKELCFKSKNADKPFLLLNIGDIKKWERQYLLELGVESGEDIAGGYFQGINEGDSPIQIMMGSKVFSEGWDSNRVNLICFINIGSKNAKKYVLQTIGRGVRIEPFRGVRKRLEKCVDYEIRESLCKGSLGIETLFIMASNNEAIKGILEGLEDFMQTKPLSGFVKSKTFEPLLVPKYKDCGRVSKRYRISQQDFEGLQGYIDSFDEDVLLLHENIQAKDLGYSILLKIRAKKEIEIFGNTKTLEPKNALKTLHSFFQSSSKMFERFEPLSDEICHYQKFSSTLDFATIDKLNAKIKNLAEKYSKDENTLKRELEENKITLDEYTELIKERMACKDFIDSYELNAELQAHYYKPLVLDEKDKGEIIYAIREQSEIDFLKDLQKYIEDEDNALKEYQWCFSRIVENVDLIYIPYFDEALQEMRKFYPDFIFWLKHKESKAYKICFVDPKGLEHEANPLYKLEGFKNIFKGLLTFEGLDIKTFLFYYNKQNYPIKGMENHIKSNISSIFKALM